MKIIYVENVRVPSERAHAYQISQTCAWFARLGHDVTLVNPDRAGGKDIFTEYGLEPGLLKHVTLRIIDPLSWDWFPLKRLPMRCSDIFCSQTSFMGSDTDG